VPTPSPGPPTDDAAAPLPDACAAERSLYVSHDAGSDANDGCTRDRPIRTIGAALALAAARKLDGYTVRVCGGVYAEQGLRLSTPVSVVGQYNCSTWTRGPENLTRVENAAYPASTATLTIAGSQLGREVVIDGLVLAAPLTGTTPAVAVLVDEGAGPSITNVQVVGGGTSGGAGQPYASCGVEVQKGASPEIAQSKVTGGSGVSADQTGSVGVFVHDAAIDLHDTTVEAGTGKGIVAALGVRFFHAVKSRIAKTTITFGGSTATNGSFVAGYGIYASGVELDISESVVRGGISGCGTGAACVTTGIVGDLGSKVSIERTTVYGGDIETTSVQQAPTSIGVLFGKDAEAVVTGNVFHGGGASSDPDTQVIALDIAATKSVHASGNTLIANGASGTLRMAIRVGGDKGTGTGNNFFTGNLLVAANGPRDFGIGVSWCAGASVSVLKNNAFLNVPYPALNAMTDCAYYPLVNADVAAAENTFGSLGAEASGNVMLRPSCTTGCINVSCTTALECSRAVFESWDDAQSGLTTITSPVGLRLKTTGACALNQGAGGVLEAPLVDFFGTARTAPFSIGHHEVDTCSP
jgi:hypothetical protein